jgi:hypothetical protein
MSNHKPAGTQRRHRKPAYLARRAARKLAKAQRLVPAPVVATQDNSWDLEGNIARALAMKP